MANITELKVMKSAAGYYIGRAEVQPEGYEFPYSRESGYFPTAEAAQFALDATADLPAWECPACGSSFEEMKDCQCAGNYGL